MDYVHLQGIGKVPAIPARKLVPGMIMVWNYGNTERVTEVTFSKTRKMVIVGIKYRVFSKMVKSTRKLRADRLVAVRPE